MKSCIYRSDKHIIEKLNVERKPTNDNNLFVIISLLFHRLIEAEFTNKY